MPDVLKIRRGFVEWDLRSSDAEEQLWEVGVRAALARPGVLTTRIAPAVRGRDVLAAEVPNRAKFNVYVHREGVQVLTVNPREVLTRHQVRAALREGKYVELRLRPLLEDLGRLVSWLEVLEPEITLFSTPVGSPKDVKSPLDIGALLEELTEDPAWPRQLERGLEILVELMLENEN